LLAVAGGIIAVVAALVGLGRSYFKNQELIERAGLIDEKRELTARLRDAEKAHEEEIRALGGKLAECEAQRGQLSDKLSLVGRAGGAALALKSGIDGELQAIMRCFGASGSSIYVPVSGPRGNVRGLAFLSIEPFTPDNQKLKSQIIPLRSLAGRCFESGKSGAVLNAAQDREQYSEANEIAKYRPSSTVNVALAHGGDTIGVLQLLRKEGEAPFREADVPRVAAMAESVAEQVFEATRNVGSAKLLGLAADDFTVEGTVLIFDLSRSALLFQELASNHALLLLNELFERMCEIAFAAGATLDTYMGDGALLRFNVPRALADHEYAAVKAALEMRDAFSRLRNERWLGFSTELAATHLRAGLSSGPLLRANLGHSQVQRLTVLGYPVSVASALCDAAPRERSAIFAAEETVSPIRDRIAVRPTDKSALAKAARFTTAAYEIVSLH
jgi:class 3 adenylate cyclase